MRVIFFYCIALNVFMRIASAQLYSPVTESYLAAQEIHHGGNSALNLDLLYVKQGGPPWHIERQLYLAAFVASQEDLILKILHDPILLDKKDSQNKKFLDVLIDKKLISILDSKVAIRNQAGKKLSGAATIDRDSYQYEFAVSHRALFQAVNELGNFNKVGIDKGDRIDFPDIIKFLAFVPVNDSPYATKIARLPNMREDNAKGMDSKTSLLYCKPLSYEFIFQKTLEGELLIRID